MKKKTYTIKVSVSAAGNLGYDPSVEQTVTIKLDEENVKGFYLYLDATSSDKVNKKTKYTFKITNVDFE